MPSKIPRDICPLTLPCGYGMLALQLTKEARKTKTWADALPKEDYNRLVNCRTVKADFLILLAAKWNWMKGKAGYTKKDCLVDILELLDCNGLEEISDLKVEKWEDLLM